MTVSQKDGLVLLMVIAADALVNLSTWAPDRWAGLGWAGLKGFHCLEVQGFDAGRLGWHTD